MPITRADITPEMLQKALKKGVAKDLSLPGLGRDLLMIEFLVFDLNTTEIVAERKDFGWIGYLPDVWVDQLEECYLANFK